MLLGAAALLMSEVNAGNALPAPVRLLFQPAEETSEGARQMVAEGALEGVGAIFGGHLDRRYRCGGLVVQAGCVNASTDTLKILLRGRAGHGARPHECVDAVVMAASLVMQLQTIVSREVPPASPAVVTIGRIQAGEAYNVVAGEAALEGTVRALDPAIRTQLHNAIQRMAQGVAQAHGGAAEVRFERGVPPVINHAAALPMAHAAAAEVVGEDNILALDGPNMGGEDFAVYLQHVPGVYVRYGAAIPGEPNISAHSATWDFHEDTMAVGAAYLARVARLAAGALAGDGSDDADENSRAFRDAAAAAAQCGEVES
jgi:amidohydrolase